MIEVEEREEIRRAYHVEKKNIREISRELGYSRQTIRKAIAAAGEKKAAKKRARKAPVLGTYKDRIMELYAESERQPRKQRYTARTIYKIVSREGYTGSISTLGHYLAGLRQEKRRPEVYLPLEFDPGTDAQVDWGEAVVVLNGQEVKVQLFVMRLSYSRRIFMMAFPTQRQESFFEGHVEAFKHFGGVTQRISYDNLKVAVQEILRGKKRKEQQQFIVFRSHYLFDSHFCTPAAGNEKGSVEHGVGYVRRNYLTPLVQVSSYQELNAHLVQSCLEDDERQVSGQPRPIKTMGAEERLCLRPLPPDELDYSRGLSVILNPYSQVVVETNRYSVPVEQGVRVLTVKLYPFRVEIYRPGEKEPVAVHPRSYGHQEDIFDPLHYLSLLERRPGALNHAKPIRQWRLTWPAVYETLLSRLQAHAPDGAGVREFIRVLRLHQTHPADLIELAVKQSLEFNCAHADGVTLCLRQIEHPEPALVSLDLSQHPTLDTVGQQPLSLKCYNRLLSEGGQDGGPVAA
jgi:transposase